MICPTCNQPVRRADSMLVDLLANKLSFAGVTVRLTARESEILDVLWQSYPRVATPDYIIERVNGYNGGMTIQSLRQHLTHIRKKLIVMPVEIHVEWNRGYRLFIGDECIRSKV